MAKALDIVVIIMAVIILAFSITDIVYIVKVRNGYVLTSTDITALIAINVILAVIAVVILLCAIVALTRGSTSLDVDAISLTASQAAALAATGMAELTTYI